MPSRAFAVNASSSARPSYEGARMGERPRTHCLGGRKSALTPGSPSDLESLTRQRRQPGGPWARERHMGECAMEDDGGLPARVPKEETGGRPAQREARALSRPAWGRRRRSRLAHGWMICSRARRDGPSAPTRRPAERAPSPYPPRYPAVLPSERHSTHHLGRGIFSSS